MSVRPASDLLFRRTARWARIEAGFRQLGRFGMPAFALLLLWEVAIRCVVLPGSAGIEAALFGIPLVAASWAAARRPGLRQVLLRAGQASGEPALYLANHDGSASPLHAVVASLAASAASATLVRPRPEFVFTTSARVALLLAIPVVTALFLPGRLGAVAAPPPRGDGRLDELAKAAARSEEVLPAARAAIDRGKARLDREPDASGAMAAALLELKQALKAANSSHRAIEDAARTATIFRAAAEALAAGRPEEAANFLRRLAEQIRDHGVEPLRAKAAAEALTEAALDASDPALQALLERAAGAFRNGDGAGASHAVEELATAVRAEAPGARALQRMIAVVESRGREAGSGVDASVGPSKADHAATSIAAATGEVALRGDGMLDSWREAALRNYFDPALSLR